MARIGEPTQAALLKAYRDEAHTAREAAGAYAQENRKLRDALEEISKVKAVTDSGKNVKTIWSVVKIARHALDN